MTQIQNAKVDPALLGEETSRKLTHLPKQNPTKMKSG